MKINKKRYVMCCVFFFKTFFAVAPLSLSETDLVDIAEINARILLDMRYATVDNFTKQKIYDSPKCYFRRAVALKLDAIQQELEKIGLGLKIWDGYRPLSAQRKLWAVLPDRRFVMPPEIGSRHNRGASVDLTIVDKHGNEIVMPTGFDEFSPKVHPDYMQLPKKVIKNRQLLKNIMAKHDFLPIKTEWWHFDHKDWATYDLLDISI